MSGHTPGPWKLETVQTSVGLCHKIGPFPWRSGKENNACVYDDYASATNPVTQELLANARLIAAAPDLLHCLKVIVGHADGLDLDAALHLDEARAAIAKAKGEVRCHGTWSAFAESR